MISPERKGKVGKVLNQRQPDLAVVMENVFDPHNVSAIMRSCDAVGIQEVYILITEVPDYKKFSAKSSAGAASWLTSYRFSDVKTCMEALKKKYTQIMGTHLSEDATDLYDLDLTVPTALVFGNEKTGISQECLSYCTGNFMVPQVGMVQSLNVSVACAVTLFEAYRQRKAVGFYERTAAAYTTNELGNKWKKALSEENNGKKR
jgi:tRNA (guanosine-2'-O-)-methyltransferase